MPPLTPAAAESLLEDNEVIPVLEAALSEAKEIHAALLEAGVPALLGRDDHCTKGCAPKVLLLTRPMDIPRVQAVLRDRWAGMLATVGAQPAAALGVEAAEDNEPPCPACGAHAALVDGACPDCGLQLG
jgi:hypothetical protein